MRNTDSFTWPLSHRCNDTPGLDPGSFISIRVDKYMCPECIRNYGKHIPMLVRENGQIYWDYYAVKKALEM